MGYDRDQTEAAHHFQIAIALNPDYAPAHHWLGLLNSTRGRPEMAIACLERARKLDPNRSIYAADLALCNYVARRYNRAIECCLKAIETLGEDSEFYSMLALSYHFDGQREKAVRAAERTVELAGHDIFSLCVVAEIEAAYGDRARARALLTEVQARAQRPPMFPVAFSRSCIWPAGTGKRLSKNWSAPGAIGIGGFSGLASGPVGMSCGATRASPDC